MSDEEIIISVSHGMPGKHSLVETSHILSDICIYHQLTYLKKVNIKEINPQNSSCSLTSFKIYLLYYPVRVAS